MVPKPVSVEMRAVKPAPKILNPVSSPKWAIVANSVSYDWLLQFSLVVVAVIDEPASNE